MSASTSGSGNGFSGVKWTLPYCAFIPLQRVRVRVEEGAGQRVDAAMRLPAGERDKRATSELEGRHAVADRLYRIGGQLQDLGAQVLQRVTLAGRQGREIGVDRRVIGHGWRR